MLRTRLFVSHKISTAIDDFFLGYWLLGSLEALEALESLVEIKPQSYPSVNRKTKKFSVFRFNLALQAFHRSASA